MVESVQNSLRRVVQEVVQLHNLQSRTNKTHLLHKYFSARKSKLCFLQLFYIITKYAYVCMTFIAYDLCLTVYKLLNPERPLMTIFFLMLFKLISSNINTLLHSNLPRVEQL